MLRHYDELGLLVPKTTDDFTGYRYYAEEQLTVAGRIAALRDMGFGLAAIGEILKSFDNLKRWQSFSPSSKPRCVPRPRKPDAVYCSLT